VYPDVRSTVAVLFAAAGLLEFAAEFSFPVPGETPHPAARSAIERNKNNRIFAGKNRPLFKRPIDRAADTVGRKPVHFYAVDVDSRRRMNAVRLAVSNVLADIGSGFFAAKV
jgi:hypothetical protein